MAHLEAREPLRLSLGPQSPDQGTEWYPGHGAMEKEQHGAYVAAGRDRGRTVERL